MFWKDSWCFRMIVLGSVNLRDETVGGERRPNTVMPII